MINSSLSDSNRSICTSREKFEKCVLPSEVEKTGTKSLKGLIDANSYDWNVSFCACALAYIEFFTSKFSYSNGL